MKRLAAFAGVLLLAASAALTGCSYDDSELWKNVNDLKNRIEALEEKVNDMNTEIKALRKIADESISVVKVTTTSDGYIIDFSDNTSAEIKHGTPGAAGADAPVIGIKEDTDGVFYWTLTSGGVTEWMMNNGAKLRVTGESITPVISVDAEGFWAISYDNGSTYSRILDAAGDPVSAVADDSSVGSLFSSITHDEGNVYFELANGSIITVPIRSNFYMLIRKAPEVSTFTYGETQVYEVEAVGVNKSIITKPDGWKVTYADNTLTIKAPSAELLESYAEQQGTVSIIYFSSNGQSDVVSMDVVAEPDYTGQTVGTDFTVDITSITDKSMTANITPADKTMYWYVGYGLKEKIDAEGTDYLIQGANGYLGMLGFYSTMGWLDSYAYKGDKSNFSLSMGLQPGTEYYAVIFGFEPKPAEYTSVLKTEIMKVPFKTQQPVVINTVYRIDVSDISWYGAKYVTVPSDDLGYFHGFVKKSELDTYADDAAFMKSRIDVYADAYRQELYYDQTMTWDDLTAKGTQTVTAPIYDETEGLYETPLADDTEYYVYAFSCINGDAGSPLSKKGFKTGKFIPSQDCTFEITTTVDRQNVEVKIVPSNRNTTYMYSVVRRAIFEEFESAMQYAVDDLVYSKVLAAANSIPFANLLTKGEDTYTWENLYAATGYVVYVYGCSEDGLITTLPAVKEFATKGTVDEFDIQGSPANTAREGKLFPHRR